jgi:predicted nucleic acid-binding protein
VARRRVLVDTSLFIEHLRARDKASTHLHRIASEIRVETCAIVAAELYYGATKLDLEEQVEAALRLVPICPFTVEMAARMSSIVRELRRKNRIQDLRDVMIAATALELGLPVATLNRAHFGSIAGLKLQAMLQG